MNVILYDEISTHLSLYPLTLTRPISKLRVGILLLDEKWKRNLDAEISYFTAPHLQSLFPVKIATDNLVINSCILPDDSLIGSIKKLSLNSSLTNENGFIAARIGENISLVPGTSFNMEGLKSTYYRHPVNKILKPWDLFLHNSSEILNDFIAVTSGRNSLQIPDPYTRVYHERNIFIEEGVGNKAAVLNAEDGPIYLGTNAILQEGVIIHGPAAILEGAVISMGAKIRENNTIGPYCKVGGEVKNNIFFGNSNKAHDGYLGNSVIGEWCNLGANTNNSNLKNNYSNVRVWDYESMQYGDSGQQFCGVFMGDHSKTAIGTRINTGSVIGVSANVFGSGLTPKFIPSFSWGGYEMGKEYDIDKAIETAAKMMERRGILINNGESELIRQVFKLTAKFRQINN